MKTFHYRNDLSVKVFLCIWPIMSAIILFFSLAALTIDNEFRENLTIGLLLLCGASSGWPLWLHFWHHRIEIIPEGVCQYGIFGKINRTIKWREVTNAGIAKRSEGVVVVTLLGGGHVIRWTSSISDFDTLNSIASSSLGFDVMSREFESWKW